MNESMINCLCASQGRSQGFYSRGYGSRVWEEAAKPLSSMGIWLCTENFMKFDVQSVEVCAFCQAEL